MDMGRTPLRSPYLSICLVESKACAMFLLFLSPLQNHLWFKSVQLFSPISFPLCFLRWDGETVELNQHGRKKPQQLLRFFSLFFLVGHVLNYSYYYDYHIGYMYICLSAATNVTFSQSTTGILMCFLHFCPKRSKREHPLCLFSALCKRKWKLTRLLHFSVRSFVHQFYDLSLISLSDENFPLAKKKQEGCFSLSLSCLFGECHGRGEEHRTTYCHFLFSSCLLFSLQINWIAFT